MQKKSKKLNSAIRKMAKPKVNVSSLLALIFVMVIITMLEVKSQQAFLIM